MTSTALAIRPDQNLFDDYQRAVLKQLGIGDDVHNAELASYLHICQRTGLDPFSGQIHLIGRWDKKAGRVVYRPQTGIAGYQVIAQRTAERTGGKLGYEDTLWADRDGQWADVWLKSEPPAAAKVTVLRNGERFPAVAHFAEYVPTDREGRPMGLWGKMPAGQLAKCAEALSLRKAFPNDMAGVYTAEEMEQADATEQPDYRMVNDPERDARGLMTSAQRVEHTALRRMNEPPPGAVQKLERTPDDDQWYDPQTPAPQAAQTATPDVAREDQPAVPDSTETPHRTQAGKPALDKLGDAFAALGINDAEDQAVIVKWLAGPGWTATARQVNDLSKQLIGYLEAAGNDPEEARSQLWMQYREMHPEGGSDGQ